jgi:hypothetical protein
MNPTQTIAGANEYASAFEQFIVAHPISTSVIVALLVSWVATSTFKFPLRLCLPDHIQDWCIRFFDCVVAFAVMLKMWPGEHALVWAALVGLGSPIVYGLVAAAVCWKWPAAKRFLTLRELHADEEQETENDGPAAPPTPESPKENTP